MMTATVSQEARVRRAHLTLAVGVLIAAALTYLGAVLLTVRDLPDRLATHFGVAGVPNDSMATPLALTLFGIVAVGVPALLLAVFASVQWWRGGHPRQQTALVTGLAAGLVAVFVQLLWAHRGVPDASAVRFPGWAALAALAIAFGVGAVTVVSLPAALPQPKPTPATPLPLEPSDRVSWFGEAHTSRTAVAVMALSVAAVIVATLVSGLWWLWFVALLVAGLMLSLTTFRVRIDARGLTWRSAIGVPRGLLALGDISAVSTRHVQPGDYGGYGIRMLPGTTGIITRAGEALVVAHRGHELVITVDDATTAASVLEGLRLAAAAG